MFHHSVHYSQQLPHAGGNSGFFSFAGCNQPFIEALDDSIASSCHQSSHVENRSYFGSSTPNSAFPAKLSAVMVERRHACKCSDLLAIQSAKLRKLRQQSRGKDWAYSWDTPQQVVFFSPDRAPLNEVVKVGVHIIQFLLKPGNVSFDVVSQRSTRSVQPVLLRGNHLVKLRPSREDVFKLLGLAVRKWTGFGVNGSSKISHYLGINSIRFRQLTHRLGVVSYLPGIYNRDRYPGSSQSSRQRCLKSTGGFHYHQNWSKPLEAGNSSADTRVVVPEVLNLLARVRRDIQGVTGNIDSYIGSCAFHSTPFFSVPNGPSLHDAGFCPDNCSGSFGKGCGDHAKPRSSRPR